MRRSPRNLRIACNHRGLTHFGGIYFFHEFVRVLQVRRFLTQNLDYPRRNQRYSLSQMKSKGDAAAIRAAIAEVEQTLPSGGMVWSFSNHKSRTRSMSFSCPRHFRITSAWNEG